MRHPTAASTRCRFQLLELQRLEGVERHHGLPVGDHSQESGDYTVMPRPEAARARVLVPTHDLTLVLASRHAKDFGFRARCHVADFFHWRAYLGHAGPRTLLFSVYVHTQVIPYE